MFFIIYVCTIHLNYFMQKIYFFLFVLLFSFYNPLTSSAQQAPCATVNVSKALETADPVYAREREEMIAGREQRIQNYLSTRETQSVRRISIVVHVVYNGSAQNVSDALIADMIQTLNEDFRRQNADASSTRTTFQSVATDAQIEFCLDHTIRVATTHSCFSYSTQTNEMKHAGSGGSNAVDPAHFLNVWIVDICGGTSSGVAGYAYLPTQGMVGSSDDGLVLDYSLGMASGSRTATHEIGHYFNLCHTWSCDDNYGCSNDDGFSDTPQSYQENFNSWSNCFDPTINSCTSGSPDLPDQTENYMDYAVCPNMFTIQQAAEMNSILSNERSALLNSTGCSSQSGGAPVADFSGTPTSGPPATNVQFTDLSTNSPTQWAWVFGDSGTSTTQNPSHTYANVGLYTVTLTATNGSGSDSETKTNYININTGGSGSGTCDTAWSPVADGTLVLYTAQGGGYVAGNNGYADKAKAQKYTPVNPISYITDIIVYFGGKKYTSGNPNSAVVFNIYNMNGPGVSTAGNVNTAPGTIIVSGSVAVSLIDTSGPMLITFPSTATVTADFAVGIDLTSMSAGDTVGLVSTTDGDAGNTELSWEKWSDNTWHTFLEPNNWQLDLDLALIPIECDQLSVDVPDTQPEEQDFYVYPNPATNELNIVLMSNVQSPQSTVHILNATWQLVTLSVVEGQQSRIDISNLAAGIYFVQLSSSNKTKTIKFIIAKK